MSTVDHRRTNRRGPCASCGRLVRVTAANRTAWHVAPDGTAHLDLEVVGLPPLAPPRSTTCHRCRKALTADQISNGGAYCGRRCSKAAWHAAHPGRARLAGLSGRDQAKRMQLRALRTRLEEAIAPAVRRFQAGRLTTEDLLHVAAAGYRMGKKDTQAQVRTHAYRARHAGAGTEAAA